MTYTPKLKQLILLCLVATFVLAGCSDDDPSSDEDKVAEQTVVEDKKATARKTASGEDSLYARSLRKEKKPNTGDYKKHYTSALDALEKQQFDTAEDLLMKAVDINDKEQLVVKFFGMRVGSYLPQYHLGMIAFLNDECEVAMRYWDASLGQGVIQKAPEYQYLQAARPECERADS